jgi:hypothetical protein
MKRSPKASKYPDRRRSEILGAVTMDETNNGFRTHAKKNKPMSAIGSDGRTAYEIHSGITSE